MTATDEASPAAQDSQTLLTTERATPESQGPHTDSFQLIPNVSDDSQTSPVVPSLNGAQTQPEPPADPKVAALLAMFPDFDTSLLQSVLESVAGDQDRAVDVLLGMSDPSYTSSERADLTQTELDEEIARRLMLEESEQHAARRPRESRVSSGYVPYQPRSGAAYPSDRQRTDGDGATQFQEQLGKFAETGKKTFSTFLSKVKAKMQEFDGSAGQAQPSGAPRPLPGGDSWNTPVRSQTYYAPNPPTSVHGYDLGTSVPSTQPSMSSAAQPVTAEPRVASDPPNVSSSPLAGAATGSVDHSKLGLLPKRPVALGSSAQPSRNNADDDEVEYVENPFEESAHR
ncbi:hypothetical protein JB92DRAFT_3142279 [Gautieria morchelliformis]|nr:hypothetical protein JB92DRAFT_3142279 [Gautieria morchelliformis]